MPRYTRQTATLCTIAELRAGTIIPGDDIRPTSVQTAQQTVSRVSILGILVHKERDSFFVIDDGSGTLIVRSFDLTTKQLHAVIGDVILVVGRPREYNEERYLVLEISKKKNSSWLSYRKKELDYFAKPFADIMPDNNERSNNAVTQAVTPVVSATQHVIDESANDVVSAPTEQLLQTVTQKNPFETIIEKLRELDTGGSVDVEELLSQISFPDAQQFLRTLIEEGEIFEIRAGKVKVLE